MATKKTAPKKMGRPAKKYIAVTFYLAFEPTEKLKDMMSEAHAIASSDLGPNVAKVTVKKSDGPYPKKITKALVKKVAAKKPAAKKARKKG